MRRALALLLFLSLGGPALMPAPARACSFSGPGPYTIDPAMQATDSVAPTLPPLAVTHLQRGEETGGCTGMNTCDGFGSLALGAAASDDVTLATALGYRFSLVAGALPRSFAILLDQPSAVTVSDGQIWFNWDDGTEDHAPIDFTLQVTAIDRAGNESAPQTVRVTDDPGGCAIVRPHARGLAWVAGTVLLIAARRRRSDRVS